MIESIFQLKWVVSRHQQAPLLKEREEFLAHCQQQGTSHKALHNMAPELIAVIRFLRMEELREVSKSSQRNIRRRIKSFTKRRAPIRPAEFVKEVNQTVRGWVNYYRHTNASDAFRRLQRFINTRFRRYLNYRSKGRGFGWKKYPNAALYTLGIIYIGSGVIRYE